MDDTYVRTAAFIEFAVRRLTGESPSRTRILDFGCGSGQMVAVFLRLGFDGYGCDMVAHWSQNPPVSEERLSTISLVPYRLPFDESAFDIVVSSSVLEHAQNKEDCFREIHRVLRPGGYALHLYPAKWYLPGEPHIYVPLVNYLWPNCPRWWLGFWALIGIRNEFQQGKRWKEVLDLNHKYCGEGLSYWTNRQYRALSLEVFGNCSWPMHLCVEHSPRKLARILRRLPFNDLVAVLSREFRTSFMVQQKSINGVQRTPASWCR